MGMPGVGGLEALGAVAIEPLQLAAFVLSPLGWAVAYWKWVHPHRALGPQTAALLMLLAVTFVGGLCGPFVWWFPELGIFGWKLPLLASRMLSGAGWAFALVTFAALQSPTAGRVHFALVWIAVYVWPLAVIVPLAHLDRFDFSKAIVYPFFAIVLGLAFTSAWFLVERPWQLPAEERAVGRAHPLVSGWLVAVAVVMAPWAVALLATDKGVSDAIWIWPGDLLTTRLIAVMLLTIAVGAWMARRSADLSRVMLGAIAIYGTTAVAANLVNALAARPFKTAYVVVFAAMALGSIALLVATPGAHAATKASSGRP
jgi:hypothetical protein